MNETPNAPSARSNQAIPHIRFSTDDYAKSHRFEAWQDEVVHKYLNHDICRLPGDDSPYFQRSTSFFLGEMRFSCFEGSGVRVLRTRKHVADQNDDFVFRINRRGPIQIAHYSYLGGRTSGEVSTRDTSGVLASNGRVSAATYGCSQAYGALYSVGIPRKALVASVRDVDACQLQFSNMTAPILQSLIRYADDLLSGQLELSVFAPEDIGNHMLDLVCTMLGPTRDAQDLAQRRGVRQARLGSILKFVKHSFSSGGLKIAHVAYYLGTTDRYVQQLLEENGTTFSELVLRSRLQAAGERLSNPKTHSEPINTVALQCGFNDVSYFCRTFKRQFGATPRDFRSQSKLSRQPIVPA